jgi:hypothetical protein
MLTPAIVEMLSNPGSFNFVCSCNGQAPFLCHAPHGDMLYRVTEGERQAMKKRATP